MAWQAASAPPACPAASWLGPRYEGSRSLVTCNGTFVSRRRRNSPTPRGRADLHQSGSRVCGSAPGLARATNRECNSGVKSAGSTKVVARRMLAMPRASHRPMESLPKLSRRRLKNRASTCVEPPEPEILRAHCATVSASIAWKRPGAAKGAGVPAMNPSAGSGARLDGCKRPSSSRTCSVGGRIPPALGESKARAAPSLPSHTKRSMAAASTATVLECQGLGSIAW